MLDAKPFARFHARRRIIENNSVSGLRTAYLTVMTLLALITGMLVIIAVSILTLGQAKNFLVSKFGGWMGRFVLFCAGVKIKFEYLQNPTPHPAIYIGNHSSTLDIFLILAMQLPAVRFVAKHEFLYNPPFAIMGLLTGQIFIKRQDSERAIATLNRAYARIRRQRLSLFLMPEGTRMEHGQIGPFKKGAFRMAMDLQYPIVPIYFGGARRLCPGKSLQVRRGTVLLRFNPAVDTRDWTPENLDENVARVHADYVRWHEEFNQNYEAMLAAAK